MKADLARREPAMQKSWEEQRIYAEAARGRARPADVRSARRPAVRQRRDPHRPRRQQDAEGHRRQVAHDGRLRFAVRPRLGLPRPADRAPGREDARQAVKSWSRALPRGVPRVCADADRAQRADFKRLGVLGDWEHPYLTMEPTYEAQQIRALGQIIERPRLQGREARVLVSRLPLGARRSGSRVRGQAFARDRRALRGADNGDLAKRIGARSRWRHARASSSGRRRRGRCPRTRRVALARIRLRAGRRGAERLVLAADLADAVLKRAGVDGRTRVANSRARRSKA